VSAIMNGPSIQVRCLDCPPSAVAKAAELAKLGSERRVTYLERSKSFEDEFIETLSREEDDDAAAPADALAWLSQEPMQQVSSAITEVRAILSGPSIQARCLECPSVAPANVRREDMSFLALLKEWLS
jgi:protease-4